MAKDDIVIVKSVRTPVGRFQGALRDYTAVDLGTVAVSDLMQQTGVDPESVDGIIMGWAAQDYTAKDLARETALRAGLPDSIVGETVQRNCGTGTEALGYAMTKIRAGRGEVYIVGGAESLSNIPNSLPRGVDKQRDLMGSRTFYDPLFEGLTDPHARLLMGGVANFMAFKYGISKEQQDEVGLWSHQRAHEGAKALLEEMVSAETLATLPLNRDEGVRAGITLENLTALQPFAPFAEQFLNYLAEYAQKEEEAIFESMILAQERPRSYGAFSREFLDYIKQRDPSLATPTVTPANASQISDGGIAALVMTEGRAEELGFEPLVRIRAVDFTAIKPNHFPVAPAFSMMNALQRANETTSRRDISWDDIRLFEINEAFAVVPLASQKVLREHGYELDLEDVNVNGGACAIGHPLAVTGLRIITSLAYEMQRRDEKYGMASICIQGGLGGTAVLERNMR